MSSSPDLEKCRSLLERGFYSEAIREIENIRSTCPASLDCVILATEVHINQGYLKRAYDTVSEACRESLDSHDPRNWALQMLQCYIEPFITAQFATSIKKAEQLLNEATDFLVAEPTDSNAIVIALYNHKLLALGQIFQSAEFKTRLDEATAQLKSLTDLLMRCGNLRDAFRVAAALPDPSTKSQVFETLIEMKESSPLLRAKAQAELAVNMSDKAKGRRNELLLSAYSLLASQHYHKALDIEAEQIREAIMSDQLPSSNLDTVIAKYKQLDYPTGMQLLMQNCVKIANKLHDMTFQRKVQQELKELATNTGTHLLWIVFHFGQVSQHALTAGLDDLTKTTLVDLVEELDISDLPYLRGSAAQLLANVHIQRLNVVEALKYATLCEAAWCECLPNVRSMGRIQRLKIQLFALMLGMNQDHASVLNLCEEYAEADLRDGLMENAISNYETMLQILQMTLGVSVRENFEKIIAVIEKIKDIVVKSDAPNKDLLFANKLKQEADSLLALGRLRADCEMEMHAIEVLEQAVQKYTVEDRTELSFRLVHTKQFIGLIWQTCYQKLKSHNIVEAKTALDKSEVALTAAVEGWERIGFTAQNVHAKYLAAWTGYESMLNKWTSSDVAMQIFLACEQGFDDRRDEISISTGIDAVSDKQQLAKDGNVSNLYRFAFHAAILEGNYRAAWEWIQKAKARSLSDTLGLGCMVPTSLLLKISSDPEAKMLHEKERDLARRLQESAALGRLDLRLELRETQAQMKREPVLKDLLDLRRGASLNAAQLDYKCSQASSGLAERSLIFVDWFIRSDDIYILIKCPSQEPIVQKLTISLPEVQAWLDKYQSDPEGRELFLNRSDDHPNQALRKLDALIEPLEACTSKGSTMVLCPTAALSRVPLHALRLPGLSSKPRPRAATLIERNPIVYAASLTIFVQCCEKAMSKIPRSSSSSSLSTSHAMSASTATLEIQDKQMIHPPSASSSRFDFTAIYEEISDVEYDTSEQKVVYEFARQQANTMSTTPTTTTGPRHRRHQLESTVATGHQVTPSTLRHSWENSDWIYFHGHCLTTPDSIIDQALILSSSSTSPSSISQEKEEEQERRQQITVKDIFKFHLNSPHLSLMACESATQKVETEGDEPLGLITALLCAGAASVAGTMWPIASATARRFAELFHEEIRKTVCVDVDIDVGGGDGGGAGDSGDLNEAVVIIDLAKSLQTAVLRMKRDVKTRMPYHWAAFVLHGSCFAKVF